MQLVNGVDRRAPNHRRAPDDRLSQTCGSPAMTVNGGNTTRPAPSPARRAGPSAAESSSAPAPLSPARAARARVAGHRQRENCRMALTRLGVERLSRVARVFVEKSGDDAAGRRGGHARPAQPEEPSHAVRIGDAAVGHSAYNEPPSAAFDTRLEPGAATSGYWCRANCRTRWCRRGATAFRVYRCPDG